MAQPTQILDRLARDGRIAGDWVAGLRKVDCRIDAKIQACLEQVAGCGPYFPAEHEQNALIWRAFELPLARVRVLILGQDPYPSAERATGWSFSAGPHGDVPASLGNIYRELAGAGYPTPSTGDLTSWTVEGVMLLNRALTLPRDEHARPKRHIRFWSPVASATMLAIRTEAAGRPIAAMLWGVPAVRMRKFLEPDVHVFASSHPSPISVDRRAGAERRFRGSNPFAEVNNWLTHERAKPVDWTLSE